MGHQKRIKAMLSGRADVKEQFGFVSASQVGCTLVCSCATCCGSRGLCRYLAQAESLFLQCFSTDSNEGTELVSLARSFADQIPVHTVSGAQVLKHCAQHQCVGFVWLRHHSRGIALTLRVVSCRFAEATQRLLRRRWPSRVSSIGAAESSGAAPRETPRCCWWMCQAHVNTMACRSPRGSAASVRNPRPACCMHGVG